MLLISCYVLKVIEIGFWANGGLIKVKLPIDSNVGSEVIVVRVKLFISICPDAWPFISDGTVDKLLNPNVYASETYCDE